VRPPRTQAREPIHPKDSHATFDPRRSPFPCRLRRRRAGFRRRRRAPVADRLRRQEARRAGPRRVPADGRRPRGFRAAVGGRGRDQVDRLAPGADVVAEGALAALAQRRAGAVDELARLGVPGRRAVRGGDGGQGRRSAAQLHHRLRRRTGGEPEGALSLSPRDAAARGDRDPQILEGLGFAADPLDRATEQRENAEALAALRARADARTILIARDMPVLMKTEAGLDPLLPLIEIEALGGARVKALLGVLPNGAPVFAALLGDEAVVEEANASDGFLDRRILVAPGRDDLKLVDLRSIAAGGLVPPDQASMLASAKALMHWHARRRFCSNCGR